MAKARKSQPSKSKPKSAEPPSPTPGITREWWLASGTRDDDSPDWRRWSLAKLERERGNVPEVDALFREFEAQVERWTSGLEPLNRMGSAIAARRERLKAMADVPALTEFEMREPVPYFALPPGSEFAVDEDRIDPRWAAVLVQVHCLVRASPDEYREAGRWLDREYGEEAVRERRCQFDLGGDPGHVSTNQMPGVKKAGDTRLWRINCVGVDVRHDPPDLSLRAVADNAEKLVSARRVLLWICVATDSEAGEYAADLTQLATLSWSGEGEPDGFGRAWHGFDDLWLAKQPWRELILDALAIVEASRRASGKVPLPMFEQTLPPGFKDQPAPLRLWHALGGLQSACEATAESLGTIVKHHGQASEFRLSALNALARDRGGREGARVPLAEVLDGLSDLSRHAAEPLQLGLPASFYDDLRAHLAWGRGWCNEAILAIKDGGADALDNALNPGTARRSVEITKRVHRAERIFIAVESALGIPNVVLDREAADAEEFGRWFGNAREEMEALMERGLQHGNDDELSKGRPLSSVPNGPNRTEAEHGHLKQGLPTSGMFTATDLATTFEVPYDSLRKRLERWRAKNALGSGWVEDANATSREARYLYDVARVRHIIDAARSSIDASTKRPSNDERMRKPPGE